MRYELEPYGNILVIELEKQPEETKGGIILAPQAQKKPTIATVIAVGTGQKSGWNGQTIETFSKVGDKILVYAHGVQTCQANNQVFHIISESDIIGKLSEVEETINNEN
jgi:chaperonin GroES